MSGGLSLVLGSVFQAKAVYTVIGSSLVLGSYGGERGTLYEGLYGEAQLERCTFFRLQVYKRVDISLAEIYKREEICHLGLEKGPKGLTDKFNGFK